MADYNGYIALTGQELHSGQDHPAPITGGQAAVLVETAAHPLIWLSLQPPSMPRSGLAPLNHFPVYNLDSEHSSHPGGQERAAHIHGGPIEVGQGRVDDAIVLRQRVPLDVEDVRLAEQVQQDAPPQRGVEGGHLRCAAANQGWSVLQVGDTLLLPVA